MSSTISIRIDDALRHALEEEAARSGRTVSSVVRDELRSAFANRERPLGERIGHLRGIIDAPVDDDDPWRKQIRERNWRR
jgi:hypothetical protein